MLHLNSGIPISKKTSPRPSSKQGQVVLMGLDKQYIQCTFTPPCAGTTQPLPLIHLRSSVCFSALLCTPAAPAEAVCLHCRDQAAAVAGSIEGPGEAVQPGQLSAPREGCRRPLAGHPRRAVLWPIGSEWSRQDHHLQHAHRSGLGTRTGKRERHWLSCQPIRQSINE